MGAEDDALASGQAGRDDLRARIISATAALLARGGRDAVSTRAVATAAGTQPPAIYRLFGDKSGLLDAVAEYGFAAYLEQKPKARRSAGDPVAELRAGWDSHVSFGLANPALFSLMYGNPEPGRRSPAASAALAILHEKVRDVAAAGRLAVSERHAADLMHAAGCGVVLTLLEAPEPDRDLRLSEMTREIIIGAITSGGPGLAASGPAAAANALRARLGELGMLTDGERHALSEWLDRISAEGSHPGRPGSRERRPSRRRQRTAQPDPREAASGTRPDDGRANR
jgi:AcrR family transcriptional regulator